MKIKKILSKGASGLLATGATLAAGFLAFSGMFLLASSLAWAFPLVWCTGAFVLAAAYEGQINYVNIASAIQRLFDRKHLHLGIVKNHLNELIKKSKTELESRYQTYLEKKNHNSGPTEEFDFLFEYYKLKKYLKKLESIENHSKELHQEIHEAQKQLRKMELAFLKVIRTGEDKTDFQKSVKKYLPEAKRSELQSQIKNRTILVRLSWLLAIAGGICCGLATFSAMQASVVAFAALSIIPGGALIALSIFAAVGYALLLYRNTADMIQQYGSQAKNYFSKQDTESAARYAIRCVFATIGIALAIFATISTAGTWWPACQKIGSVLGGVSVVLMSLSTLVYNVKNSLKSVSQFIQTNFTEKFNEMAKAIKAWKDGKTFLQSLNPFYHLAAFISYFGKGGLFVGHLASMGAMGDNLGPLPPALTGSLNAVAEGAIDLPQLDEKPNDQSQDILEEGHGHSHTSPILEVLFFPITLVVNILKVCAVGWDLLFSWNFKESKERMFPPPAKEEKPIPNPPRESKEWCAHDFTRIAKGSIKEKSDKKIDIDNEIKNTLENPNPSALQNCSFFHSSSNKARLEKALENYRVASNYPSIVIKV